VVVDYLDILRAGCCPPEADAVSVIDSDAVLAFPIAAKGFEPISRRYPKIFERVGDLQLSELAPRHRLDLDKSRRPWPFPSASVSRFLNETIIGNSNAIR
jgi:hypothetical protein